MTPRPRAWDRGSTRAWRRIRSEILLRDQGKCRLKLDGCTTYATQVHHLDGKDAGDNPDRLIAACEACNQAIGDPTRHTDPYPQPRTNW
jgi:5-methylcytosine-specific restriction endonuclease McrA